MRPNQSALGTYPGSQLLFQTNDPDVAALDPAFEVFIVIRSEDTAPIRITEVTTYIRP